MRLQNNGKLSSGKKTRQYDIKLFYITDLIKRSEVQIRYCQSDNMGGDCMSEPSVGAKI